MFKLCRSSVFTLLANGYIGLTPTCDKTPHLVLDYLKVFLTNRKIRTKTTFRLAKFLEIDKDLHRQTLW